MPKALSTLADYENAKTQLIDSVGSRTDVVTFWQYGEVTQPGVSDLDLIAIVKDNPEADLKDFLHKERLPIAVCEAMAHANLIILPESSANGAFYWDDIRCKDIKTGWAISTPQVPQTFLKVAMLVDWFFERTLRIYSLRNSCLEKPQHTLGLLKSYCYSLDNFFELSKLVVDSEYVELKTQLLTIRTKWQRLDPKSRLRELSLLFFGFYILARQLHQQVFTWFERGGHYPNWNGYTGAVRFIIPDGNIYEFVDTFEKEIQYLSAKPIVLLPRNLLHHFLLYSQPERALGSKLEKSFSGPNIVDIKAGLNMVGEYASFLRERIDFAADWHDYLKRHGFDYGLFKYGWYIKDHL